MAEFDYKIVNNLDKQIVNGTSVVSAHTALEAAKRLSETYRGKTNVLAVYVFERIVRGEVEGQKTLAVYMSDKLKSIHGIPEDAPSAYVISKLVGDKKESKQVDDVLSTNKE